MIANINKAGYVLGKLKADHVCQRLKEQHAFTQRSVDLVPFDGLRSGLAEAELVDRPVDAAGANRKHVVQDVHVLCVGNLGLRRLDLGDRHVPDFPERFLLQL